MFFWNVAALKDQLALAPLSHRAALKYLVAALVAYEILIEVNARIPVPLTGVETIASIANLIILIYGTLIAYAANGGDRGSDFLGRYLALGWVLGVRFVALIVVALVVVTAALLLTSPASLERPDVFDTYGAAVGVVISGLFYWRLSVHIRQVAFQATRIDSAIPDEAS